MDQPVPTIAVEPKKTHGVFFPLIGCVILMVGIAIGLLVGKYIYTSKPTLSPTVSVSPTPVSIADPTANWKTYINKKYGYQIKYPSNWKSTETDDPGLGDGPLTYTIIVSDAVSLKDSGYVNIAVDRNLSWNQFTKNATQQGFQDYKFNGLNAMIFKKDGYDTSINLNLPTDKLITTVTYGFSHDNSDKETIDQILSTFKFTGIPVTPTSSPTPSQSKLPKYNYAIPSGWPVAQDQKKQLQVNYNPKNEKTNPQDPFGVTIYRLVPATGGYPSNFFVDLLSYTGSDQHQFIYKSMEASPQKGDLTSGYKEIKFYLNDWKCLSLDGISISQYHAIWGMCDIGNQKAIFYTSGTNDYITYLKTVSIL